jgi:transposase
VTTLYFETSKTDVLREPGFSKDGKTAESQVVLGLLVSSGGYPLSYSLYNGSQYEGYTMIPMIDDFRQRYGLGDDFVVVADSGLMNADNLRLLRDAGYKYVIGARIKMFHFTERRIEAHVCICFVAYKVYRELERIIALAGIKLSVDKVLDIAKTITTIRVNMPQNHEVYTKTLFLSDEQNAIKPLFDLSKLGVE